MSRAQRAAIHDFTEECVFKGHTQRVYENINSVMRGKQGASYEKGNEERANHIHEALHGARLPQSVLVRRCINRADLPSLTSVPDGELAGKLYMDTGFVCTSYVDRISDLPRDFYEKYDTVIEIYAPAGSRGVNIETISVQGAREREVLFDKNQLYKIDSVRYENGKRILRVLSLL